MKKKRRKLRAFKGEKFIANQGNLKSKSSKFKKDFDSINHEFQHIYMYIIIIVPLKGSNFILKENLFINSLTWNLRKGKQMSCLHKKLMSKIFPVWYRSVSIVRTKHLFKKKLIAENKVQIAHLISVVVDSIFVIIKNSHLFSNTWFCTF